MDGKCLQVSAGPGSVVNVASCTDKTNQKFIVKAAGAGFTVTQGGLCVDNNSPAPPPRPPPPPAPPPPPPADDPLANRTATNATVLPGSLEIFGPASGHGAVEISATVIFVSENVSLIRLRASNGGAQPAHLSFLFGGTATNLTQPSTTTTAESLVGLDFGLPSAHLPGPCFSPAVFSGGGLRLAPFVDGSAPSPVKWTVKLADGSFLARSSAVTVAPKSTATTYVSVSSINPSLTQSELAALLTSDGAAGAFNASESRWSGYLQTVLGADSDLNADMKWTSVKALQTLIYNWRTVPGVGEGVLPSYNNYDSGACD